MKTLFFKTIDKNILELQILIWLILFVVFMLAMRQKIA